MYVSSANHMNHTTEAGLILDKVGEDIALLADLVARRVAIRPEGIALLSDILLLSRHE
jgi:hypothetical protein